MIIIPAIGLIVLRPKQTVAIVSVDYLQEHIGFMQVETGIIMVSIITTNLTGKMQTQFQLQHLRLQQI